MALNGLSCADVPLSNYSLTHYSCDVCIAGVPFCTAGSVWMKIRKVPTSPGYVLHAHCLK